MEIIHPMMPMVLAICAVCGLTAHGEATSDVIIDLGHTFLDRPVICRIPVENKGSDDLRILDVNTGGECLTTLRYPSFIPPGGVSDVVLLFLPAEAGEVFKHVDITVERPGGEHMRYEIQGLVDDALDGQPPDYTPIRAMLKAAGQKRVVAPDATRYCVPEDLGREPWVLVDIRPEADYREAHIPGSINVPAYAVASRGFLKGKSVALVDDGMFRAETETFCSQLERSGIPEARILEGGILRWREEGRSLEGESRAEEQSLKPGSLSQALRCERWQVLYVGTNISHASLLLPGSPAVSLLALKQPRPDALQVLADIPEEMRILVVGDTGVSRRDLETVRGLSGRHVYSLEGGLDAYIRQLALLANLGQSKTVTTTSLSRVSDRAGASNAGTARAKRGCGCSGS